MYQCNYLPTAHQLSIFCCGRKFSTVAVENFLPLHCEPFAGEAIPDLSGQIDRLGIASSQRALLARTCTNGFDAGLNSYDWGTFSLAMLLLNKKGAVQKPDSPKALGVNGTQYGQKGVPAGPH
jgi:hypothetical protein